MKSSEGSRSTQARRPLRPPHHRPLSEDDQVAVKSDIDLRVLGWTRERIQRARRALAKRRPREGRAWRPQEDARLGNLSDPALARQLGRSTKAVKARRQAKRIRVTPVWRPADDQMLGTRPDRDVAQLLGRSVVSVAWRRRKLGIPCCYKHRPWHDYELAIIGVKPDAEVARLTGHPLQAVALKRQQLGKPKADQVMDYWTPEEDKLLGTMPDAEVAGRIGRDGPTRKSDCWAPGLTKRLPVAWAFRSRVRGARERYGIRSAGSHASGKSP